MSSSGDFVLIKGIVSALETSEDQEVFVGGGTGRTAGAVAAVGLASEGLAGAAAGAAQFSSDIADKVTQFQCKVGDLLVAGRFGAIGFAEGDLVEVVGRQAGTLFSVYAVARPKDRSIWMHPHCGRGSRAFKMFAFKWVSLFAWLVVPAFTVGMIAFNMPDGHQLPLWAMAAQWSVTGAVFSLCFGFVASRFWRYAKLSDQIFAALELPEPKTVNLQKTLSAAMQSMTQAEKLKYHPMKRWVYRY
jgi:hypothetical protein